jgi:alkylated DNA repair dioxygenase AlkB
LCNFNIELLYNNKNEFIYKYKNIVKKDIMNNNYIKNEIDLFEKINNSNESDIIYIKDYLTISMQENIIEKLEKIDWQSVEYQMYGKTITTPRKTFCYGQFEDNKYIVKWKGKEFETEPFPKWLKEIRNNIENDTKLEFNSCILNLYEDNNDSISFHVDAEKFLRHNTIASLSIGNSRTFKYKKDGKINSIELQSGSLSLLLNGLEHSIPKSKNIKNIRYNITFRCLKDNYGLGNYYR